MIERNFIEMKNIKTVHFCFFIFKMLLSFGSVSESVGSCSKYL